MHFMLDCGASKSLKIKFASAIIKELTKKIYRSKEQNIKPTRDSSLNLIKSTEASQTRE